MRGMIGVRRDRGTARRSNHRVRGMDEPPEEGLTRPDIREA